MTRTAALASYISFDDRSIVFNGDDVSAEAAVMVPFTTTPIESVSQQPSTHEVENASWQRRGK